MSAHDARDVLDLVWIVPALPLLGAAVLLLFGKRMREPIGGWIATGLMALAFAWSVVTFVAMIQLPSGARVNVHNRVARCALCLPVHRSTPGTGRSHPGPFVHTPMSSRIEAC